MLMLEEKQIRHKEYYKKNINRVKEYYKKNAEKIKARAAIEYLTKHQIMEREHDDASDFDRTSNYSPVRHKS